MSVKRRQVLTWGGLSGLGLALTGKAFWGKQASSIAQENVISAATLETEGVVVANSTQPLLRFVSVADTGTGAQGQYAVAEAMTRYHQQNPFDLAILAGDNIYNDGEIEKIGAVFEMILMRPISTASGVLPGARPVRLATRNRWVSTAMV
ncbi:MAG: hypothetical protein F6K32_24860, partial [Desertifilum sp. SIO1I2]|nr:hypothetical protein [Desertifilum sp. SIO1I2]